MKQIKVILSCEHAVNTVPSAFEHYFRDYQLLLDTHRGLDIGAFAIAKHLSHVFNYPLISATVSRLLIDCNRSLKHKTCFSEISQQFSTEEKEYLIKNYYLPFRQSAEERIQDAIVKGYQVWHLSIHSFTPSLNGVNRTTDIGFLYDPKRPTEQKLARLWQQILKQNHQHLRVRLNYPYRGNSDGFTTSLRKKYAAEDYLGVELECKQSLTEKPHSLAALNTNLVESLTLLLKQLEILDIRI
ncbi:N-formylglutamate amidohydrolase [Legionella busanensis]|uniref:N-formylglutamate amidohydrolase n=1 Tax=Legionella busanensis TaxID=190655 RepID=A0A378JI12_9GAMM|nr:N-formylglutamate amidohydrolase [Legionella busanensis]STX50308.1 N-formylglutamate amidohydrolase [Legionella busanensis]